MQRLLLFLLCSFALLFLKPAHADEPPALKPLPLKFSSARVEISADVPPRWKRTPPPKSKTPVVGQFTNPNGMATLTVRRLETEPRAALDQAADACAFYAQYGTLVLAPLKLEDTRAMCGIETEAGDRLRVHVVHLGEKQEVQLLVITNAFSRTSKRDLRALGTIVDSLRLTPQKR